MRRRLNKSQKFIRFLELMQRPEGVMADEVLDTFDLDVRTLRRYLADLAKIGVPVRQEGRGRKRRFRIDASYRRQGVQITLLELVSLHFGRTLFDFLEGTQFRSDMDDALERLSTLAGVNEQGFIGDLDRKFIAVREHAKDHRAGSELLDEVLSALLYRNPADCEYGRLTGPERTYLLHPYTLATYRQGLYLFALDVEADQVKTFALDRFRSFVRQRKEHFDVPKGYRPGDVVKDCFGIMGGPPEEVILHFRPEVAPYVRERIWHRSQYATPSGDGGVVLRMTVGLSPELTSWILGFGPDVRVLAPESLAQDVRRMHWEAAE